MRAVTVTLFCLMGSNFPEYVFIPTFPLVSYHHLFVFGKPQEQFLWGHGCVSLSWSFSVPASSNCAIFRQELPLLSVASSLKLLQEGG